MRDNVYQNIDQPLNVLPQPDVDSTPTPPKTKRKLPVFLLGLIFFLLILSLLAAALNTRPPKTVTLPTPTSTPATPSPTSITDQINTIPTIYQAQFKAIEDNLKQNPEILPPQIDTNLGL